MATRIAHFRRWSDRCELNPSRRGEADIASGLSGGAREARARSSTGARRLGLRMHFGAPGGPALRFGGRQVSGTTRGVGTQVRDPTVPGFGLGHHATAMQLVNTWQGSTWLGLRTAVSARRNSTYPPEIPCRWRLRAPRTRSGTRRLLRGDAGTFPDARCTTSCASSKPRLRGSVRKSICPQPPCPTLRDRVHWAAGDVGTTVGMRAAGLPANSRGSVDAYRHSDGL